MPHLHNPAVRQTAAPSRHALRRSAVMLALFIASIAMLPDAASDQPRGDGCLPNSDGQSCQVGDCPGENERCTPRCVFVDAPSGTYLIEDCDCIGPGMCAVSLNHINNVGGCVEPDNGNGSVDEPIVACEFENPNDTFDIIDGLPVGTTIQITGVWNTFFNTSEVPGGDLGGTVQTFDAIFAMSMQGTGGLNTFSRNIPVQISGEVHLGPRTPGDTIQDFSTEIKDISGQIFGDPDFDFLAFRSGSDVGLPSPGNTTLTQLPSGDFNVDSFFDVTYQIEFQGAPGSVLEGAAGTTTGAIRMYSGQTLPECIGNCPEGSVCRRTIDDAGGNTFTICCQCISCPADIAGPNNGPPDGVVNLFDLLLLLDNWNTAAAGADIAEPLNVVNLFDLLAMLDAWGDCP